MSHKLIDMSATPVRLLNPVVVDANVVVAQFLALGTRGSPRSAARINRFFADLASAEYRAILTPTGYGEVLHAVIRVRYEQELRLNREQITARFGRRITSWTDLYKRVRLSRASTSRSWKTCGKRSAAPTLPSQHLQIWALSRLADHFTWS